MSLSKPLVASLIVANGTMNIALDPRHPGVKVPPWLTHQDKLVLAVGNDLPIPIPDLLLGHDGVHGTLSFSGTKFKCFVPWSAIHGLYDDTDAKLGYTWPESEPTQKMAAKPKRKLPPGWRIVK